MVVSVHDLPFMFHVAVEDIQSGEELLTEYGEDYWGVVKENRNRFKHLHGEVAPEPEPVWTDTEC